MNLLSTLETLYHPKLFTEFFVFYFCQFRTNFVQFDPHIFLNSFVYCSLDLFSYLLLQPHSNNSRVYPPSIRLATWPTRYNFNLFTNLQHLSLIMSLTLVLHFLYIFAKLVPTNIQIYFLYLILS